MWAWVVIWLLIAVLGTAWLFLLAREVFRKGVRLIEEVDGAAARASDAASATNPHSQGVR